MKCLIVRPPFANYIVTGIKETEYRNRKTNVRGRIGIIEAGIHEEPDGIRTQKVLGDVLLWDCIYNPDIGLFEWCLDCAREYKYPFKIVYKKGSIIWREVDYDGNLKAISLNTSYRFEVEEKRKKCCELEQEFITKYTRR